jgi:hypothetical protein
VFNGGDDREVQYFNFCASVIQNPLPFEILIISNTQLCVNNLCPTTTTTTTTTTQAPYDCCIPFASTIEGPGLYNRTTNAFTLVTVPGFVNGKAIANTTNKLWAPTSTAGEIKEWNFVQAPFSATLSRTITYNSGLYNVQSLFAVNNTTLIGIDYSNPTTSRVVSIDVTTTTAVVTVLFSLPTNRIGAGNPIYTLGGNLIILNTISGSITDTYITQYSDLTGTIDLEILVSNNQIKGIFNCANSIYITGDSSQIYTIEAAFPYLELQLTPNTPETFLSTSTARNCLTLDFELPPPISVMIGDSSVQVCGGGGSPISVQPVLFNYQAASFCTAQLFISSSFTGFPSGVYYLYYLGNYVEIEIGSGDVAAVLISCIPCP